ncbi:MAG: ABC transporter substrate-binding protein [Actinomycetota bacterium]
MRLLGVFRNVLLLLVIGVMAAACAPSEDVASEAEGGGGSITVWSWRTEDVAAYEKIFETFTDDTGIEVEFKAHLNTEYDTILETALKGGKGPDVIQLRAYGSLQPLIDAGYLVPLDGTIERLDEFSQQALAGAQGLDDGRLYGVPFAIQTLQVFYNKQIFEENGIEVPATYEDFTAAAAELKDAGITPIAAGGGDTWTLPILHSVVGAEVYGGNSFVEGILSGEKDFTSPEFIDSVEAVADLMPLLPKDPAGVVYTDTQVLFAQEKAAMFVGGSWEAGYFESTNPDLDFGTFPMPPRHGGEGLVSWFTDGSYGVNAQSPNRDEAQRLVEWMASEDYGQLFVDELKQISPVPGVEFDDPLLQQMVADYEAAPTPYLLLVYFRYGDPTGTDLIGADIQKMMLEDMNPQQVGASLNKGVSQWFEPGDLEEVADVES